MSVEYRYVVVGDQDLMSIYWLSGTDKEWMDDFGYVPLPENLIQQWQDNEFRIWSGDYPEEGYIALTPPYSIGDVIDDCMVSSIELHRDENLYEFAWVYKITTKKI